MNTTDTISVRVRGASKQRILINGDENLAIFLNLSDTGILDRLTETYHKLYEKSQKAIEIKAEDVDFGDIEDEKTQKMLADLKTIDDELHEIIDYVFDGDVASKCDAGGRMYDPVDGLYRFEIIIEDLLTLYGETLPAEFDKIQKRREERTKKYAKKK